MYTISLDKMRSSNKDRAGAKGATLGEIISLGLPVPPGFVVTTEVWEEWREGGVSAEVAHAIETASDLLKTERFAVRSSATVEDGSDSAWAGQFRTFLDVDQEHLVAKVCECMASALLPGARAYGEQKSVRAENVPVAVVVQAMIHPATAGVAFSMNPVTGNRDQALIEAVSGLGLGVVDGTQTPDTYIFSKLDRSVVSIQSGVDSSPGVLQGAHAQDILQHVLTLEAHFGCPQDMEWAYAHEVCWVLQSRPVTTL
ncbi:MAG: PEP/pyruvate-binding domain-containing protein [Patescibacteria group bacterium]